MNLEPSAFPELQTERLRLREITHDDLDAMLAIHGDPDLMKWVGDPVADEVGATALIELLAGWRRLPDPGIRWGLQPHDRDQLIGTCGLFGWDRRNQSCSVGYELAHDAQGHGFMNEALTAAFAWGWQQMDLVRIEARIHPDNLASQRVVDKLGFEHEGLLRKATFRGGQHHDLFVYSLLR